MVRVLAVTIGAAAVYGFSAGLAHSLSFGLRNLVKAPLLLVGTAVVCGAACYLFAALCGARLGFVAVQRHTIAVFRDTALMLAGLSPVVFFLGRTIVPPDTDALGEYPLFLGLNVAFIAAAGTVALLRQARRLLKEMSPRRCALIVGGWLALSLCVGGQGAWYLRPFYGLATVSAAETPVCLGSVADYRGARNFFEAVLHLLTPPPLPPGATLRGWAR